MNAKLSVLLCLILFAGTQQAQNKQTYETELYKNRIEHFKANPLKLHQIVFLGNSLTQGGQWEDYFPGQGPANRGIIGDNTEGMLARLDEIIAAKPAKLFMLMGINDISQNQSNKHIYNNIEEIVHRVKTGSPATIIYIQSLLPINNGFNRYKRLINKEKQITRLNTRLKKLCKKETINFVNLYPLFLQKKCTMNEHYTTDGLHLNEAGYRIWVNSIREMVED